MKKFFTLVLICISAISAGAQAVESHKFLDNWSLGVYGGGVTGSFSNAFDEARPVFGLELTKKLTPVISVGLSGTSGFNTTGSNTAVDNLTGLFVGKANITNLFWRYQGKPRFFEVEALVGAGLTRYLGAGSPYAVASGSTFATKVGLSFNFNFDKEYKWTAHVRPALAFDMEGGRELNDGVEFSGRNNVFELTVGMAYNFKSSNGKRHFTRVKPYNAAEVDGLNAKINDLRQMLQGKEKTLKEKDAEIRKLRQSLNDCRNQKPVIER